MSTPVDREKIFRDFVEGRQHWVLHEKDETIVGSRTFDYGRYAARLWVEVLKRTNGGVWPDMHGHLSIPFSGGSEEWDCIRDFNGTFPWLDDKERMLTIPLHIAECKTYEDARRQAVKGLQLRGTIYTLGYVLDLDPTGMSRERFVEALVRRCASRQLRAEQR